MTKDPGSGILATASLDASPELTNVARDASERMGRVTATSKQTALAENEVRRVT
jgi:hypothetical protein